jgi:hypothetical protein
MIANCTVTVPPPACPLPADARATVTQWQDDERKVALVTVDGYDFVLLPDEFVLDAGILRQSIRTYKDIDPRVRVIEKEIK